MTKIQKTFLALLATATAFSASAEGSKEGNFYISGGLGTVLQDKIAKTRPIANADAKMKKPGAAFEMGIGAGYYITDSFRVEVLFAKPFLNKSKATVQVRGTDATTGNPVSVSGNVNVKLHANSVQLRGYFDLVDIYDMGKAYVGAGLGATNLSGKINAQVTTTDATAGTTTTVTAESKLKNTYNFAWVLAAGAEFDVADNTKLGVEYNYGHHGKIKDTDFTVRGHSILAKLRFDL